MRYIAGSAAGPDEAMYCSENADVGEEPHCSRRRTCAQGCSQSNCFFESISDCSGHRLNTARTSFQVALAYRICPQTEHTLDYGLKGL